jgi:acyl-CoA reductase-like NAD-dependent aldehyde dehydrogenase
MVELATAAGIPPGVLNVITGYGPTVGAPLVAHPGVNHVTFVGSTATGRTIMKAAAEHLAPVKMELGGKSPNVLFSDADLDAAIPAIVAGITENAGQNCNAGSRLLVQDTIADEVIDRVVAGMEAVRVGAWSDDLDMGPLVSAQQYQRVMGILDQARDAGAKPILGGGRPADIGPDGNFVAPTVLTGFETGAPVAGQEIFGPVLTVERFGSDADAVELANNTDFGLLACIWTNDVSRALRVANGVVAGQVTVNQYADTGVIGLPFNMAKASGFSSGNGYNAIEAFTREKAVAIKLLGGAAAW